MATWTFEPGHTAAEFCVRHMMVTFVRGHFKNVRGRLEFDPERPESGSVEIEMDAARLWTDEPERDEHLRSEHFFDVERHPRITFRSTAVECVAGTEFKVKGDLTIRGVTRPVTLDVTYDGEITDPWGNRRRGFTADGVLYRKDFGMTWNQILDAGGVLVGDKIKITLNIEAVEKR